MRRIALIVAAVLLVGSAAIAYLYIRREQAIRQEIRAVMVKDTALTEGMLSDWSSRTLTIGQMMEKAEHTTGERDALILRLRTAEAESGKEPIDKLCRLLETESEAARALCMDAKAQAQRDVAADSAIASGDNLRQAKADMGEATQDEYAFNSAFETYTSRKKTAIADAKELTRLRTEAATANHTAAEILHAWVQQENALKKRLAVIVPNRDVVGALERLKDALDFERGYNETRYR